MEVRKITPYICSSNNNYKLNTTTMKTVIYTDQMTNGNPVKVQVNRYAYGYWRMAVNGIAHEYELLVNGKVEFTF